jgi:hypothetical protein
VVDSLVRCEWCGTANTQQQFRCVVCEVELGIPTLDALRGKNLESAIRSAYTRGGARHVAERLADGRIPWRNSSIEHRCVRVALAEQLAEMGVVLIADDRDTDRPVFLGWRWPVSPLAKAMRLEFVRDGRLEGRQIKERIRGRRGVNLNLPSVHKIAGLQISYSLVTAIEASVIRTQPRVVHSTRA